MTNLQEMNDPYEAADQVRKLQIAEKLTMARAFILGSLTASERRVVELLVVDGLSDAEIAERLVLSPRTVEQHLRSAYVKAAAHWELEGVNRTSLVTLLSLYYNLKITGKPA